MAWGRKRARFVCEEQLCYYRKTGPTLEGHKKLYHSKKHKFLYKGERVECRRGDNGKVECACGNPSHSRYCSRFVRKICENHSEESAAKFRDYPFPCYPPHVKERIAHALKGREYDLQPPEASVIGSTDEPTNEDALDSIFGDEGDGESEEENENGHCAVQAIEEEERFEREHRVRTESGGDEEEGGAYGDSVIEMLRTPKLSRVVAHTPVTSNRDPASLNTTDETTNPGIIEEDREERVTRDRNDEAVVQRRINGVTLLRRRDGSPATRRYQTTYRHNFVLDGVEVPLAPQTQSAVVPRLRGNEPPFSQSESLASGAQKVRKERPETPSDMVDLKRYQELELAYQASQAELGWLSWELRKLADTKDQSVLTRQAPSRELLADRIEIRSDDIPRIISMADRAYHASAGPILGVLGVMARAHQGDFLQWEQRVRDDDMDLADFAAGVSSHGNDMLTFLAQAEASYESVVDAADRQDGLAFLHQRGSRTQHAVARMWPHTQTSWTSSMVDRSEGLVTGIPSEKTLGKRKERDDDNEDGPRQRR
ncbi:hypothetical protein V5O48_015020 [Marasmius crinis-equi]|uniref:C2H2-type domain-containing protein n=1 Tax=Marasmius crinis-equi TaxID=585013 RepID=A0ABR3EVN8_9AGAR